MTIFRKATEQDRAQISRVIVNAFEKDFSNISKDMARVAKAMETSFLLHHYFVLENEGEIVGVISVSDCEERAYHLDKQSLKKHFGWLKGTLSAKFMAGEFMTPLSYPKTTGYIENVGVDKKARRMGLATKMLEELIAATDYSEYVLDVLVNNKGAQDCYEKFGFEVFTPQIKPKGHAKKIYMKYYKKV